MVVRRLLLYCCTQYAVRTLRTAVRKKLRTAYACTQKRAYCVREYAACVREYANPLGLLTSLALNGC